jgi:predicted Rossmann fold flavoprotein
MGISVENARIKIGGSKLPGEGPLLITHWGLSGPAILKLSAWGARELHEKNYSFKVHINWVPEQTEIELRAVMQLARATEPAKKVINLRITEIPVRLWQFLLSESGVNDSMKMGDLPSKVQNAIIRNLVDYVAEVKGKTTFKEEFVTAGGIVTGEVDPNTMMSKKIPGLFFAGEVLDVDGITGGYNFQHAWTSGFIAAKAIASGR